MKKWIFLVILSFGFIACDSMEDNYIDYLKNVKEYSPKIQNLTKKESPHVVELFWNNPEGDLAVKIKIDTGENVVLLDEMVEYYKLENLEIKNYDISIYTIDKYGNLSVPERISAFPGTSIVGD